MSPHSFPRSLCSTLAPYTFSVGGLLLFAFVLRIVFLWLAGVNVPLAGDELAYQQMAENFAAGRGLFQTNNPFFPGQALYAWQAPLYPLTVGILYRVLGDNLFLAKLLNILTSTAMVYVMYDLARRIFRAPFATNAADESAARRIGWAAAFLVAIYPGFLTNAHLLLSETLFTLLLLLTFDGVARALDADNGHGRQWMWVMVAGAAWGLAALTRGITLYFTPLLALWLAWSLWRKGNGTMARWGAIGAAVVFVVATFAVIAPYTARNYAQFHQFVLLETKGGVNLWLGNSPYTPSDFIRNVWKVGVREPILSPLPTDELARDHAAYTLALNYIRAEPLTFLARMPIKFADFWGFERNLVDIAGATTQGTGWNSPAKIWADLLSMAVYVLVMLLGITGFLFAPDDLRARGAASWKLLLGMFVLYFLFAHLAIFGDGRFHLPLIPFFALYAGWLCVALVKCRDTLIAGINQLVARAGIAGLLGLLLVVVWAREAWVAWQVLHTGH